MADGALEHGIVTYPTRLQLEQTSEVEICIRGRERSTIDLDGALVGSDGLGVTPLIFDGYTEVEPVERDGGIGADGEPIARLGRGR
ncbi:MAG TPA: hypothetical protein VLM79_22345 [Kofleriaceae bacterium]|nr:hypothetical protein [Kofleriaceae bacterium]